MIKAIFFDIDGTLVPFGSHGIPQEVKDAIAEVRRKGIKVFIATGRHLRWIDNLGDTEFDGYVTVNGAVCLLSDKETCIFRRTIPQTDIERVIPFSHESTIPLVAVPLDGDIFINRIDDGVRHVMKLLRVAHIDVRDLSTLQGKEVVQMMAFGTEKSVLTVESSEKFSPNANRRAGIRISATLFHEEATRALESTKSLNISTFRSRRQWHSAMVATTSECCATSPSA